MLGYHHKFKTTLPPHTLSRIHPNQNNPPTNRATHPFIHPSTLLSLCFPSGDSPSLPPSLWTILFSKQNILIVRHTLQTFFKFIFKPYYFLLKLLNLMSCEKIRFSEIGNGVNGCCTKINSSECLFSVLNVVIKCDFGNK